MIPGIRGSAFEANKRMEIQGATYDPGDRIDVSGLPDHKVGQLLNQRFIRPVKDDAVDVTLVDLDEETYTDPPPDP